MTTTQHLYRPSLGDLTDLATYRKQGGYETARKALRGSPEAIVDEVKKANLRGRGGAGFPAGVKWGFVPKNSGKPVYLVVNADEGEPGTFKDRYFLGTDPHRLLEGIILTCFAVGAHKSYIYIRGEFSREADILDKAIVDAEKAGLLGERAVGSSYAVRVVVHRGAGAYICGEETALLNSLEGKQGKPRLRPPFPAVAGAFGCPTVVNNVETISSVPLIMEKGGDWFAAQGVDKDGGVKIFGVSGHVEKPGLYEAPMGITLRQLIEEYGGGPLDGKPIKAVIPGGSSTPVLTADELDVSLDFGSMMAAGTMFGTGCATVITEGTSMVDVLERITAFYAHETCGQCTPCREGCAWLHNIVLSIKEGAGRAEDLDLLLDIAHNMKGRTICAHGDAAAMPVESIVTKFRHELEALIARAS